MTFEEGVEHINTKLMAWMMHIMHICGLIEFSFREMIYIVNSCIDFFVDSYVDVY